MRHTNPNVSRFDGARIGVVGLGASGLAVSEVLSDFSGLTLGLFDANEDAMN